MPHGVALGSPLFACSLPAFFSARFFCPQLSCPTFLHVYSPCSTCIRPLPVPSYFLNTRTPCPLTLPVHSHLLSVITCPPRPLDDHTCCRKALLGIVFSTNGGRTLKYGSCTNNSWRVRTVSEFFFPRRMVSAWGRSGWVIDQIGFDYLQIRRPAHAEALRLRTQGDAEKRSMAERSVKV